MQEINGLIRKSYGGEKHRQKKKKKTQLSDRIECLSKTLAFVTLKDHKNNFQSSLPCRLINPSKSELGKISKWIFENINQYLIKLLCVNQWKKMASVIEWFKNTKEKNNFTFIKFDIREFYPSITETILDKALLFAKQHHSISSDNIRLIKHRCKSLLFSNNEVWKKKHTESCSDVTVGSFDGAGVYELVGIYMWCFLAKLINKNDCGRYRDDGPLILRNVNHQQIGRMRKNIKIFTVPGFAIKVETNLKIVDFLDITFNLDNGTYRPYKKPNYLLSYINKFSNHPPQIIYQLPKTINDWLSRNSSDEEVFSSSKHQYEKALRDSGYTDFQLKFNKTSTNQTKRHRQRNIIWFNPSFNRAVSTNIGKRFLQLLRQHFPPSNKLHKIFNKNTKNELLLHSKCSQHHQIA